MGLPTGPTAIWRGLHTLLWRIGREGPWCVDMSVGGSKPCARAPSDPDMATADFRRKQDESGRSFSLWSPDHETRATRIHPDRIAGGDRDHRHVDRPAAARRAGGPRGRATHAMRQQPETNGDCLAQ